MNVTLLAGLIIGLFSGGLLTWLLFRKHYIPLHQALTRQQVNEEYVVRDMYDNLQYTLLEREKEIERKAKEIIGLSTQLSGLQVEKDKLNEKLAILGRNCSKCRKTTGSSSGTWPQTSSAKKVRTSKKAIKLPWIISSPR